MLRQGRERRKQAELRLELDGEPRLDAGGRRVSATLSLIYWCFVHRPLSMPSFHPIKAF